MVKGLDRTKAAVYPSFENKINLKSPHHKTNSAKNATWKSNRDTWKLV